ncbi:MAG: 6-phosphofructokinase, partial [Oscillospiraceae bacterium]|nr:6-phosphofructokinase [Oscillospiraceae bacterium]
MSISDLIVVMKEGVIQQIDKPQAVYDNPINLFVAKFLGTPPINVFEGRVKGGRLFIGEDDILPTKGVKDQPVWVGIRPEGFVLDNNGPLRCRLSRVEVMGRDAGFLALYVGISVGATAVLIPERELDFERDIVQPIQNARLTGNTHFMIVVAEGAGKGFYLGDRLKKELGLDARVTVLGHIQRGGSPTARDRETASRMGYAAVSALSEGRSNVIIGTREGGLVETPIEEALAMKKNLQMERYEVLEALQNRLPRDGIV